MTSTFDTIRPSTPGKKEVNQIPSPHLLPHPTSSKYILVHRDSRDSKQWYGKEDKNIKWHGYQSFKPGEVSIELCHEIGVKLDRKMWGDKFQLIVTTYLDKGHQPIYERVTVEDG